MAKQIFPDAPSPSVRKIKRIPIDRERVKSTGEFFGRTFTNQTPVKRNGNFVYTIKKQGFTLDYRFDSKKTEYAGPGRQDHYAADLRKTAPAVCGFPSPPPGK